MTTPSDDAPAGALEESRRKPGKKAGTPDTKSRREVPESQPEREIFARNFRRARLEAQFTQREASRRTGISQAHISEIEGAMHNVCIDTMVRLAQLVRKPVFELLRP